MALIGYCIFITVTFIAMPENPDKITAPMNLVNEFRMMSVLGVTSFWVSVGLILGFFWNRVESHKKTPQSYS